MSRFSVTQAWAALLVSGLLDVAWAIAMKRAEGFRHLGWSAVSVLLLAAFVGLLTKALEVLPLGTAYAVWTGIGAAGSVALGIALFGEPAGAARLACVGLIVAGIVGLKLSAA